MAVQNILNIALETAEEYDAKQINEINVELGKLNTISNEQFEYIFSILSKDTLAESANLVITETEAKIKCYNCDYVGSINSVDRVMLPMVLCPECGSHKINVLKGFDLKIGDITIEK